MIMRGNTGGASGSSLVLAIMLLLVVEMREVGACSAIGSDATPVNQECQAPPPPPELGACSSDTSPPGQIRHDSCLSCADHHQTSCGCRVQPSPCQPCPSTKCGAQNRGPSCADHCSDAPSDACCGQASSTKCGPQSCHPSDAQRDPCQPTPIRCGPSCQTSDPCHAAPAKCGTACSNNNNMQSSSCHNSDPCKASTKCNESERCGGQSCCCCPMKKPSPASIPPSCCGVAMHKA